MIYPPIFVQVWSDTRRSTHDIIIYTILTWCHIDTCTTNTTWCTLHPCVQLFVVSSILYLITQLLHKLSFVLILLSNSHTDKQKHRVKVNMAIMLAVCLLPFTLFVVGVATITGRWVVN